MVPVAAPPLLSAIHLSRLRWPGVRSLFEPLPAGVAFRLRVAGKQRLMAESPPPIGPPPTRDAMTIVLWVCAVVASVIVGYLISTM